MRYGGSSTFCGSALSSDWELQEDHCMASLRDGGWGRGWEGMMGWDGMFLGYCLIENGADDWKIE